uniref:Uncharacterized protein n=1 Tax=Naja naja TaxID=35670 RepID=A0A8C6XFJ3_NAJNA
MRALRQRQRWGQGRLAVISCLQAWTAVRRGSFPACAYSELPKGREAKGEGAFAGNNSLVWSFGHSSLVKFVCITQPFPVSTECGIYWAVFQD